MSDAYIISAVRAPVGLGKPTGALACMSPVDLTALVLNEVVRRANIDPGHIDDIVWGCVTPIGDQGANLARLAVLSAGFPMHVPAVTLSRMCGSSQQAIHFAAQAILAGDMDLVIAGGTEMMSHQPLGADYPKEWPQGIPYKLVHQGISAEMLAQKYQLSRVELDDYACGSHLRAMQAIQSGYFDDQILPITTPDGRVIKIDEGVRMPPNREKMGSLMPVFKTDGVITAANASQISDGSAALLLASAKAVGSYNLTPIARLVTRYVTGSDPVLMLDGPIPATREVLKRSGISLSQIDVIEINEAFASVVLAWAHEIHPDLSKVNPNGGAIALGHPLGATGAILMTKLIYELQRRKGIYGLQTMCIGHGMATASLVERI
ncbi:MAG TPA: thiolase family protein [Anaerolineales bacterium]|nr:thiolase family protein [Anaerolineales bacterium]